MEPCGQYVVDTDIRCENGRTKGVCSRCGYLRTDHLQFRAVWERREHQRKIAERAASRVLGVIIVFLASCADWSIVHEFVAVPIILSILYLFLRTKGKKS